jgi:hypothetical protein
MIRRLLLSVIAVLSTIPVACSTTPPRNQDDICAIFEEKDDWYDAAADASKRWGIPIYTMMAMVHQESRFQSDIKPPRKKLLWVIPWSRPSSAYGYAQATDEAWEEYQNFTDNGWADRDDFEDAIDFIGWYNYMSHKRIGIPRYDTYRLYLAYHEGHVGYRKGTYKKKPWLKKVAKTVANEGWRYKTQLDRCEDDLKRSGWWFL